MKLIANQTFVLNDEYYFENDEVKVNDFDTIVRLNEKGFIKPLTLKELIELKKDIQSKSMNKEEKKCNN